MMVFYYLNIYVFILMSVDIVGVFYGYVGIGGV